MPPKPDFQRFLHGQDVLPRPDGDAPVPAVQPSRTTRWILASLGHPSHIRLRCPHACTKLHGHGLVTLECLIPGPPVPGAPGRWLRGSMRQRIPWPWGTRRARANLSARRSVSVPSLPRNEEITSTRSLSPNPSSGEIVRVDQDHPPALGYATVAVIESVDGGVVLIVAAHCLQDEVAWWRLQEFQRDVPRSAPCPMSVAKVRVSLGGLGSTKPFLVRTLVLKSSKPGNDPGHGSRMTVIVLRQLAPRHGMVRRPGSPGPSGQRSLARSGGDRRPASSRPCVFG